MLRALAGCSPDRCLHLQVLIRMVQLALAPALDLEHTAFAAAALRLSLESLVEAPLVHTRTSVVEAVTAALVQDLHLVLTV